MSRKIVVKVVVEGPTEDKFIRDIVEPYLKTKDIAISPNILTKKGQNGGDVKYERVKNDVLKLLKGTKGTLVSYFVDYYGLKEWPGKDRILPNSSPQQIASILNQAAYENLMQDKDANRMYFNQRFLPYMAVHEFEALLFSDSKILADELGISVDEIEQVLEECGSPEQINNSPITAPSKRLEGWKRDYSKTTDGIAIARKIGISTMRCQCPLFDEWLSAIERVQEEA